MRLRTSSKIIVALGVVSGLLLVAGSLGAWYVYRLQTSTSEIFAINVASIRAAEELELEVREIRNELNLYLLSHDAAHLGRVAALRRNVDRWLADAERLATTPEEQQAMQQIHRGLQRFHEEFDGMEAADRPTRDGELERLRRDVLTGEVLANARRYLDFNEQELERSNQENQQLANVVVTALVLLGTCGATAGLLAGLVVARSIRRSILQLSVPIRDVAGKLNEVVGPIAVSADPGFDDLELVMQRVSADVSAVVEQLERSHREVMRADQLAAIGQLAAGLAHELRNPLMSMKVLVQSARRGSSGERLDERDLQVLDDEIVRLENLLQTFLDFARPAQLETQEVDLCEVVEQVLHLLKRRADLQRVSIRLVNLADDCRVDADPAQLRQVLLNLLLNALDASHAGASVLVEVEEVDENAAAAIGREGDEGENEAVAPIVLRVIDEGKGLPNQIRERIFEPFYSTKDTGLGMGLPICRRIVESHGGVITAADRPLGGASFAVQLPRRRRDAALSHPVTVGGASAQP